MVTFLAGGTGTPKLLAGVRRAGELDGATVVGNTGDDVELGGLLVCPDVDTVLFLLADELDTDTWWGIQGDTGETHEELLALTDRAGADAGDDSAVAAASSDARYLDDDRQTAGREIARWRRFSALGEFMYIGDRDRAVHLARTSLLDEGRSLTAATRWLSDALEVPDGVDVLPMSDDPVATIVHTPEGPLHFQAFWVGRGGDVPIDDVEFRGTDDAVPTDDILDALAGPVVVGPSNPITSLGPMLALPGVCEALESTRVVAVSPFVEEQVFSGPAGELMAAVGYEPSTAGVAEAYPFADAFVLDSADGTDLDRPVVRTDTQMDTPGDAERVYRACESLLAEVA